MRSLTAWAALASLCLLLAAGAALAQGETVLVCIQEGSGFTVQQNGLRVLPGEDAVFTLQMERGVLLTGTDYEGETTLDTQDRTVTLTLHQVRWPTRVYLSVSSKYAVILYDANGGTPRQGEGSTAEKRYSLSVHPRPNTETGTELFSREGYTLCAWNTRSDGAGTRIGLGSRVTPSSSGTLRLYAQWAEWTDARCFAWEGEESITITGYHGDAATVVIPSRLGNGQVTTIAAGAFADCRAEGIVLPDHLQTIEDGAFSGCTLQTLTLRDDIEQVTDGAFSGCTALQTLYINAVEAPFGYVYRKESAYADKVELLIGAQGRRKLVFYGGCSMWYNLDGLQAEKAFGADYAILNLGLNGTASSAIQLQILAHYLAPGDVLFHTPELSSRQQLMLSTDMGANDSSLWAGLENNYDLFALVDLRSVGGVFTSLGQYLSMKDKRTTYQAYFSDDYQTAYLDRYGCIPFYRSGTSSSLADKVTLNPSLVTGSSLDTLAQYYQLLTAKGVTVYVSYACVNQDALPEEQRDGAEAMDAAFRGRLARMNQVTLISQLSDYLYHTSDFYDTNYHLCSEPAKDNTAKWLRDLASQLEKDGQGEGAP